MADASALRSRLVQGANDMMRAAADDMVQRLQSAAPFDTGELIQSVYEQQASDGSLISWVIGYTAPQAQWTNDGTTPHAIFPSNPGGVLHWFDKLTGEDVFARYVLNNSITGTHWFDNTISENWPAVLEANRGLLEAA